MADRATRRFASARAALRLALETLLRCWRRSSRTRPREVWSWFGEGSVHRQRWPTPSEASRPAATPVCSASVGEALAGVRKVKSEAKVGMRAEVRTMTLVAPEERRADTCATPRPTCARVAASPTWTYAVGSLIEVRDAELVPVEKQPAQA